MTIRALIADDEPLARRGLRSRLARFADVTVVAEASDGVATARAIERERPDVVFLDVDMPLLRGTDLARALDPAGRPQIVFVSAYPEFAVDAFEVSALDYLVKPVAVERLGRTVERLRARLGGTAGGLPATLTVRDGEQVTLLPVAEIDYVQAAGDYMVLHARGETLIHRATLTQLLDELEPAGIVRIHRSTLVARQRVRAVERGDSGDGEVLLQDGTRLRYSRSFRDPLMRALGLESAHHCANSAR